MGRVNLFFEAFADSEIAGHTIIRLKSGLQFKTARGWSKPYPAIVDTGAHLTAIPASIWKKSISLGDGRKYTLFGLSKKQECGLSGELARLSIILVDEEGNQTREIVLSAFLAETDQIPLLLGFSGLLEQLSLHVNYHQNSAYVEEPEN